MASHLPIALEELGRAGYLTWHFQETGPHTQKIPLALESPDTSVFSVAELGIIDAAIDELLSYGGKEVSLWSHEMSAGWRVAEMNAEIPYESSLVSPDDPPAEAIEQLRERVISGKWD